MNRQQLIKAVLHPGLAVQALARRSAAYPRHRYYDRLTKMACEQPNGPEHQQIQAAARLAFIERDAAPQAVATAVSTLRNVIEAMSRWHARGRHWNFDTQPLGFADLLCECSSRSQVETEVFLYGFCRPIPLFATYAYCLQPNMTAIDVGGNLGLHALTMARAVGTEGRVISYEPRAELGRRLQHNAALNGLDKQLYWRAVGVGDKPGEVPFARQAENFNEGLGHRDPKATETIPIVTLDADLGDDSGPIGLIKIDVEGMELEVLAGAQKVLAEHNPCLVLEYREEQPPEWSPADIMRMLPGPVEAWGIPRRLDPLVAVSPETRKVPGCDDLLIAPAGMITDPGAYRDLPLITLPKQSTP